MAKPIVKDGLSYDPATGVFVWVEPTRFNPRLAGQRAGSIRGGYRRVLFGGKLWSEHRLAWLFVHGVDPSGDIDHINGVRDDNRIANLRIATPAQNSWNAGKRRTNTSGFKGVVWTERLKKFQAQIMANRKQRHIGYFSTAQEAAAAYDRAAADLHGDFANGNRT